MRLQSIRKDKQGNYVFDQLLHHVKPFYLTPQNAEVNPNNPEQLLMLANQASGDVQMRPTYEGPFEGAYLMYDQGSGDQTGACLIDLRDTFRGHRITGRPCHVDTIMGIGTQYMVLPESLWIERRQSISVQATDLTGQANAIRPIIHGQKLYVDQARDARLDQYARERAFRARYVLPYMCPTDEDIILTGGAQPTEHYFTQDARGHFEVFKLTYVSTDEFRFRVKDENGTQLSSEWVHCFGGLGTAQQPFITYGTWVIAASGLVTFELEDLSGNQNTIYLTLIGRMIMV